MPRSKDKRPSATRRGYDSEWRKRAKAYLAEHPWCVMCAEKGLEVPAKAVDHVQPHRGNLNEFLTGQLQGLCFSCHNRKSANERWAMWRKRLNTSKPIKTVQRSLFIWAGGTIN